MKNYNKFIEELDTLVITTKERFVTKDGLILYGERNHADPQYYPGESDAELHPNYHRAKFLNLNRYYQKNNIDRYDNLLKQLSDRAKTDILILSEKKVKRILLDAVEKRDRLTRLLKKAIEFDKALKAGTLDDPVYLELQILDYFVIPNRPNASPDERFAHNLIDAIVFKKSYLSAFIKQIEGHLGTDIADREEVKGEDAPTAPGVSESLKLSHPQIAILYHLEDWPITKNNCHEIAHRYGQTSGQKLEDTYRALSSKLTRTAKGKNTINNYRVVLPLLSEQAKLKGGKELKDAETNNYK